MLSQNGLVEVLGVKANEAVFSAQLRTIFTGFCLNLHEV